MDDETAALGQSVEEQIASQGTASFRVKDGQVFVFTTKTLEVLLAKSLEGDGRVVIFVKNGATA